MLQPQRPDLHYRRMYLLAVNYDAISQFNCRNFPNTLAAYSEPDCASPEDIPAIIELFTCISEFGHTGTWADRINPAVSLAMVTCKRMKLAKLPVYLLAQLLGAFTAGLILYAVFSPSISAYELTHQIARGSPMAVINM